MGVFRQIGWLIHKDLALQFRTKDALALIIVFSVLVVLIFCFAFGPIFPEQLEERGKLAASVLWATFLFAGIITLNRSFDVERTNGALHGLRLTGVDASCLYPLKGCQYLRFSHTARSYRHADYSSILGCAHCFTCRVARTTPLALV